MHELTITDISRPQPDVYFGPEEHGFLDWDTLLWRFSAEKSYWVATSGNRPHSMPVWGIWQDNSFKFSTAPDSNKAVNIRSLPFAVVHSSNTEAAFILECRAREILEPDELQQFLDEYNPKYKWSFTLDDVREGVFALEPYKAFAWAEGEGDGFSNTATRWTFESEHT